MYNSKTIPTIDEIRLREHDKDLIKDIDIIINWYNTFCSSSKGHTFYTPSANSLLSNAYKCLTLAISRYINRYPSPLSAKVYEVKQSMEGKILSIEFLDTDEPTYEWLIDTFQYTVNIPANTPNSRYTRASGKQISVRHNLNYVIFNKLALLVKDKTIPFTIDFNTSLIGYHEHITFYTDISFKYIIAQLILIQTLKARADSNIVYTLFEKELDKKLKQLLTFESSIDFIEIEKPLNETIQATRELRLMYLRYSLLQS